MTQPKPFSPATKATTPYSRQEYHEYDNALQYLQDIIELPKFYFNILNNDNKTLNISIPQAIQNAMVMRDLEFGAGMLDPADDFSPMKVNPPLFNEVPSC